MKQLLFGTVITMLMICSCKSDDPEPNPITPAGDKYMTTSTGSSWNYNYVDHNDASNNGSYTVTSTNSDSVAAGKSYHVYTNSDGGNEYYNISGSDYYTLQAFSLGIADTTLENLYLKDNVAQNTSWYRDYTLDVGGNDVALRVTNTIKERGITKTVGATTYNNVIHVVSVISSSTITTFGGTLTTNIHYYYAPKYGMIQNDAKIDLVLSLLGLDEHIDTQTTLTSATLL